MMPPLMTSRSNSLDATSWRRLICAMLLFAQDAHLVVEPQVLPPLQRDRHVALAPESVVELPQLELFPVDAAGVGQEPEDLPLADLVGDCLARSGREEP